MTWTICTWNMGFGLRFTRLTLMIPLVLSTRALATKRWIYEISDETLDL
jgi:hypothetical protein